MPAQLADAALEVKFNPYHDPENGRFTFKWAASTDGGSGSAAGRSHSGPSSDVRDRSNHERYTVREGDSLSYIAATRVGLRVSDLAELNGLHNDAKLRTGQTLIVPTQAYLDRGKQAFDNFVALDAYIQSHGGRLPPNAAHPPSLLEQTYGPGTRQVTVNGYTFTLDPKGRTVQVTGTLTSNPDQKRSRQAQAKAGGSDRLPSDDGGHYIARQFNGPTEAFNHFAQDASFNRGDYRKMEQGWAAALRKAEKVHVTITPTYSARSQRPSAIRVQSTKGGITTRLSFNNTPKPKGR